MENFIFCAVYNSLTVFPTEESMILNTWYLHDFTNCSNKLPRKPLVTICKTFIRPHLDYGDIVYDEPNNETFINNIEKAQYDAALAITSAIRGTSWEKL